MMASTTTDEQPPKANKPILSKRQRRAQGPNPTNTWQQQPKIKSAGARARAYISYAGLNDDVANGKSGVVTKKSSTDYNNTNKTSEELLNPTLSIHSPEVKFGRLLGGTDQRSRHAAVKMLREYLRSKSDFTNGGTGLSELDLMKLWKGLWYTLYMADKQPVQDKLSKILAELMWCLSGSEEEDEYAGQVYLQMENGTLQGGEGEEDDEGVEGEDYNEEDGYGVIRDEDGDTMEVIKMGGGSDEENEGSEEEDDDADATMELEEEEEEQRIRDMNETHCRGAHLVSLYISTFLRTVRREWGNVDKHRVDKFYTAVRFMISEAYKYMAKRHWNLGIIRLFNDVLYSEGLSADTPDLTNGLRYHLIDICVDELAKVNKEAELPLTEATILDCFEPFFALAQKAEDKNVQKRVMENVLAKFLNEYSFVCTTALDEEAEEEEKALLFSQVHVGTVSKFIFEVASDPDTDERFRKSLYEMHKMYVRQIRAAGRDVDLDAQDEEDSCATNTCDLNEGGKCDKMQEGADEEETTEEKGTDEISNEKEDANMAEEETKSEKKKEKKHKKKKSKKGDKKNAKEEEEEAPETPKADEPEATTTPPPKAKSSKKKRKKQASEDAKVEVAQEVAAPETPKSKKKKRKQEKEESTEDKSDSITTHVETPTKQNSKKKNKKQKQQPNSPPSVDPRSMHSPDQVISPNTSDNDDTGHGSDFSASKRVSFGKMNHCKSWKASMKAIKVLDKDTWDTVSRTPDKSILRIKEKERAAAAAADAAKLSGGKKKKKKSGSKPPLAPSSKKGKKRS